MQILAAIVLSGLTLIPPTGPPTGPALAPAELAEISAAPSPEFRPDRPVTIAVNFVADTYLDARTGFGAIENLVVNSDPQSVARASTSLSFTVTFSR